MLEFVDFLKTEKIEFTDKELEQDHDYIKGTLRRQILTNLYGQELGYKISIEDDEVVQKAMELIGMSKTMQDLFNHVEDEKAEQAKLKEQEKQQQLTATKTN